MAGAGKKGGGRDSIAVRAPSSTANLGPGFDVFGLAIDAFYDTVTVTKTGGKGITVAAPGGTVPTAVSKNTAGLVVRDIAKRFGIKTGLEIEIKKGVPAGFGMGSSAASAAAAAVAMNELFGLGMGENALVGCAGVGERAAAGSVHYDNVAASVLGGFVIVRTDPLDVIKVRPPGDLVMCVAVPKLDVPKRKTMVSRGVVPARVPLRDSIANLANASSIVAGFFMGDPAMIGSSIRDAVVEPARKHMIPGFDAVKAGALGAGALGVTISGAGPSVIAFCGPDPDAKKIGRAMEDGFDSAGVGSCAVVCRPSGGAARTKRGRA